MNILQIIHKLCFLLIGLLLLCAPSVSADTVSSLSETAEQAAVRLQENYQHLDSLSFNFFQKTEGQMAGRPKTGNGNAVFVRTIQGPKIRWNYTTPDRQVIISDSTSVSMYFEKLNQLIVSSAENTQADILFSFFTEEKKLSDTFTVLDADPSAPDTGSNSNNGLKIIYLIPKDSSSQIRTVHIWVTADSQIRRIELIDHFETRTTINISEITVNTISPKDQDTINGIFAFTPPEGTEIIRQ